VGLGVTHHLVGVQIVAILGVLQMLLLGQRPILRGLPVHFAVKRHVSLGLPDRLLLQLLVREDEPVLLYTVVRRVVVADLGGMGEVLLARVAHYYLLLLLRANDLVASLSVGVAGAQVVILLPVN